MFNLKWGYFKKYSIKKPYARTKSSKFSFYHHNLIYERPKINTNKFIFYLWKWWSNIQALTAPNIENTHVIKNNYKSKQNMVTFNYWLNENL